MFLRCLRVVSVLSIAMTVTACGEESDNEKCSAGDNCKPSTCVGETLLSECKGGEMVVTDCATSGMVCEENKCVCTESVCIGEETLKLCEDGKFKVIDCGESDQVCKFGRCENPDPEPPCESSCGADGVTLNECIGNTVISGNCSEIGMVCSKGECVEGPCEDGTVVCDGSFLKKCEEGKFVKTDCSLTFAVCSEELGICDPIECEDDFVTDCADLHTRLKCNYDTKKLYTDPCKGSGICQQGNCITDPCSFCTADQYCVDDECLDELYESPVGIPCSCSSRDCYQHITVTDFKKMMTPIMVWMVNSYFKKLGPNDDIVIPDIFSPSNRGCEVLADKVPEGMKVGCFRDAKTSASLLFSELLSVDLPSMLAGLQLSSTQRLSSFLELVAQALLEEKKFVSPHGYCTVATVRIGGKVDQYPFDKAIRESAFEPGGIVDKINAGDYGLAHSKAEEASLSGESYCPEGSILFDYNVHKVFDGIGYLDTAMAVCLRECESAADCRPDYECIEIPTELVADLDSVPHKKACFSQENADSINGMFQRLINVDI